LQWRPSGQTGPSVLLCPNCHGAKDGSQSTCPTCYARSCPTGHIMPPTARICPTCNWVDRQWKMQSTLFPAKSAEKRQANTGSSCPNCGNKLDPRNNSCSYCGYIATSEFEMAPPPPPQFTNKNTSLARVETYSVKQQTMGKQDKRRTYLCPNCGNRIDNPKAGQCSFCGYVGGFEYDISKHQPSWTSPSQTPAPPLRQQPMTTTSSWTPQQPAYEPPYQPPYQQPYQQSVPQQNYYQEPAALQPPAQPRQKPRPASQPPPPRQQPYLQEYPTITRPAETTCPKCGAINPAESRFCQGCGARYSIGRMTKAVRQQSSEEWSHSIASAPPEIYKPIYDETALEPYGAEEMPGVEGDTRKKGGKKAKTVKVSKERSADRKFPIGLLAGIMVVVAMIIGLGIYVGSRGNDPGPGTTAAPIASVEISNVAYDAAPDGTVTVKWTTDKSSTTWATLCDSETNMCANPYSDTTLVMNHTASIAGIKAGTVYHLTMQSKDEKGGEGQLVIDVKFGAAAIAAAPTSQSPLADITAPKITDVKVASICDIGASITWKTDEPATSEIDFGATQNYGASQVDTELKTDHSVILLNLKPGSSYYFKVVSKDKAGNVGADTTQSNRLDTLAAIDYGTEIGKRAYNLTLQDLNGNTVTLSTMMGKKIVMINFWGTWCNPCLAELPYFKTIYNTWNGKPMEFLGIDCQDSLNTIKAYVQNDPDLKFPILHDSTATMVKLYGVSKYPTTFFVDQWGVIKFRQEGNFTSLDQITKILNGL
jgi:peroxiredoxin/ribosomal protein L37E